MENKCTFFVWNEYSVPVGGFLVNSIWKDDSVFLFIDSGKWAQELPRGWDPGMISFSPSGAHQAPQRKQVRSLPNAYIGWKRKNSQTERWEKELRKTGETRWSPREHAVLLALQMLKNKVSSSEKSVLSPKRVNFSLVPHVEDCMALHEGELTFFFF